MAKTNWASRPIMLAGPSCSPPADLYRPSDWIRWPPIINSDPPFIKGTSQPPQPYPTYTPPSPLSRAAPLAPVGRPLPLPLPCTRRPRLTPPSSSAPAGPSIPSVAAAAGALDPSQASPGMTRCPASSSPTMRRPDPHLPRVRRQWRGVVRHWIRPRQLASSSPRASFFPGRGGSAGMPSGAGSSRGGTSSGRGVAASSSTRLWRSRLRPRRGGPSLLISAASWRLPPYSRGGPSSWWPELPVELPM
jgi:hypothetical protein